MPRKLILASAFLATCVWLFAGNVKTIDGVARANIKTLNGVASANLKTLNGVDSTTSVISKTGLIAWYDFADANDSHNAGPYNLTANNTPSYTAGPPSFGSAAPTNVNWTRANSAIFATGDQDWTFVIRWKARSGIANGDYIYYGNNGYTQVRYITAGMRFNLGATTTYVTGPATAEETWFCCIVEYDATTDNVTATVNGTDYTANNTFTTNTTVAMVFGGGTATTTGNEIDIDYFGFFSRKLTSTEKTWIYNSGGTRTYAEF